VISGTRKILDTAAADHNNAMLLKVVAFAGDRGRNFDAIGKTNSDDLTKR
jgi:hypothetical protein